MYATVQAAAAKPTVRTTPFQSKHVLEFGLKVNEFDVGTQRVSSVRCQFCVYYGCEQVIGQKYQG